MMKKIHTKVVLLITILFLAIFGGIIYMQFPFEEEIVSAEEQAKREIDEYNFEQLKKVKAVLRFKNKNSYQFGSVKEFNEEFNQNIQPIKNCYFLRNRNSYFTDKKGGGGYIFGFLLESDKYIEKNGGERKYAYPKYDLPVHQICAGDCWDSNAHTFGGIISNPCEEE